MSVSNYGIKGLTEEAVIASRKANGYNEAVYKKENGFLDILKNLVKEPMVILLLSAATLYFVSGKTGDGIFLASAIVLVSAISLYQNYRSQHALEKLKDFTQPVCKVIRNGVIEEINSRELVVDDCLMVEEGNLIAADGIVIHSNDFSVNESILTGESMPVYKDRDKADNIVFQGTSVSSGLAIARITQIGMETRLGKIGKSMESIRVEQTPLEIQINNFVKKMVIAGALVFCLVWIINFLHSGNILDSLLKALTLAMSILPEEIPVAFTTFMAMGAWRLMRLGVVVKQMKTVETLGSATVICTDKTGTLTENRMSLAGIFVLSSGKYYQPTEWRNREAIELITLAMWASEPIPFDPMEVALHEAYCSLVSTDERPGFKMIHEYPLGGKPPMMTHLFEDAGGRRIIASKGAPEALLKISDLSPAKSKLTAEAIDAFTTKGYRVLGVGKTVFAGNTFPEFQQDFPVSLEGIVAFYDPPKKNIRKVLEDFYQAGIAVKIVTGDNAATTQAIAREIGFRNYEKAISGDELMNIPAEKLGDIVSQTFVFTRMFPDAKLKIINALKKQQEVVAMTGDGVNDGPALKASNIGIAMGSKGTEIAKEAASLILMEDDLSKMVDAVSIGRKIYANLKKAIQYIISIHIPIVLTVFVPLVLGWKYPNIFSPVHIIFLELIMGPTCSMIYENEPMEKYTMQQKPRPLIKTFFNWKELATSLIQGLVITLGTLGAYVYAVHQGYGENLTRTMVFTTLIAANIFLTLVNRSFYYSVFTTLKYRNRMIGGIILLTITITVLLLMVKPLSVFFGFSSMHYADLLISIMTGFISATWFELVKWKKRRDYGFS